MTSPFALPLLVGVLLCPTATAVPVPATAAAITDATPIATVDGEPISKGEYKEFLFNYFRGDVLDVLINERIIQQIAKREKVVVTPEEAEAWIDEKLKEAGALSEMQGIDLSELRGKYRRHATMFCTIERLIKRRRLTEEGLKREYDLRFGEKRRARHILVAEADDEAAKKKVGELHEKIKGGADFAEVAKTESRDPGSAERGGDLPEFSREDMVPEFAEVAFKLKESELSAPVRSEFGWHLIQVTKIVPPARALDDKLREELRSEVEKRPVDREEHSRFLDDIRKGIKIEKKLE